MLKYLFIFLILFLSIDCIDENPKDFNINVYDVITKEVGINGTVIVNCDNGFITTRRDIFFESNISNIANDKINYIVNCGFFAGENSTKLYLFCDVKNNIPSGIYKLQLEKVRSFIYDKYNVILKVKSPEQLNFSKVYKNITDLYSDQQTIIIDNKRDFYELKFKVISFNNNDTLVFNNYMFLNNCEKDNNIIECLINKNNLFGYLSPHQKTVPISYFRNETHTINELLLIPINIVLNYTNKEDIFVGITKLLINNTDGRGVIAYETNVTNISNYYLINEGFNLTFIKTDNNNSIEFECHFMKYDANPLLLLCFATEEGTFRLKSIKEEIIIKNFSIKYNYIIQKVENNDTIKYTRTGSFIYWYFPKVLNFRKFGNITMYFFVQNSSDLNGLTYNETAGDLHCFIEGKNLKVCNVTKEHFQEKSEGFYYIKHNYPDKKIISYEVPPIKVLFYNPDDKIILLTLVYSAVIFVAVLLLIVI